MQIAVGGFGHETNTFANFAADYHSFGDWLGGAIPAGEEMLDRVPAGYPIHGFVEAAREAGFGTTPLLHAFAPPANRVARDAYERIAGDLLERIAHCSADAIYMQLHGAMVAEHVESSDAELLRRIRELVGPNVPLVASFDLHGNVDPACIDLADGIVAYRTYPHVDYLETGRRTFELLAKRFSTGRPLARSFRRIPFLMPLHRQTTEAEPCASLYRKLAALEANAGQGTKLSLMCGFPPSDVPQCGASVLGYGADQTVLDTAVEAMFSDVLASEPSFGAVLPSPSEAVAAALHTPPGEGPVLLADLQDNPGGGAGSDSSWIMRALLEAGAKKALVGLIHDPEAARIAHDEGVGGCVDLALGGRGEATDEPLRRRFTIEALHDGPFALKGPMFGGSALSLGKMALLCVDGLQIAVVSRRTFYIERESFRVLGVDPEAQAIVVVKSTNHYRADFAPISRRIIEFAAPAAVRMNPAEYRYTRLHPGMRLHGCGPAAASNCVNSVRRAAPA